MALLNYQQIDVLGTNKTYQAVAAGGDSVYPDDRGFVHVKNASASAVTVTLVVPGTAYGQARPDITKSIAAAGEAMFGPLVPDLADPSDGQIDVTYSASASVTIAAVRA